MKIGEQAITGFHSAKRVLLPIPKEKRRTFWEWAKKQPGYFTPKPQYLYLERDRGLISVELDHYLFIKAEYRRHYGLKFINPKDRLRAGKIYRIWSDGKKSRWQLNEY